MKNCVCRKLALAVVCVLALSLIGSCNKEVEPTTGNIQGIVTDASNNEPIQGVNISLSPTGLSAVTGSDGRYEFVNLEAGQYTVQGVKKGYLSNTKNITIVAGNTSSGDMMLTPELTDFKLNVDYLDFGSNFSQLNFKVTNTSNSLPISWSITESLNWLTATPSSGNLNAGAEVTVVVNIDRSLIEQSTSANITVSAADKDIVLPINVSVSGSDGPHLQLSETILDFGSSANSLSFFVMNTGPAGTSLNWNCSTINVDWLALSPSSGNTPGGSSTAVMATIDRNKIDGIVSTAITISGAGTSSTITVQASSEGSGNAILQLSEGTLNFGGSQTSLTFQVKNVGTTGTVLEWVIMEPDVDWLTLTPMTGHTNSGSGTLVTAAVDRTKFTGTVSTTVMVNSQNNNASLSVSAENKQPKLEVSTETVDFGSASTTQSFTVKNSGDEGTTLKWTMAAPTVDWLTATPLTGNLNAGSSKTVNLTIDRTKFTGDVTTSLVITAGNQSATVTVTASTAQTVLTVTPTTIDFGKVGTTKTFTIKNEGEEGSVLNWNIATPAVNWLTVSPTTGSLNQNGSRVVTLTIDRTKFTGDVTTSLVITAGNQSATVTVTASTAQTVLTVTPTTIDFGKVGTTKTFTIKNEGEEGSVLNWNIATPAVNWLTVSPTTGSLNQNGSRVVTLTIDRTKFTGDVSTTLQVTGDGQSATVSITASTAEPTMSVPVTSVDFGKISSSETIQIKNTGDEGSTLSWSIAAPSVNWLTVSPMSGNLNANQSKTVNLSIDRTKFDGDVSTTITVTAGSQSATVSITASTPVATMNVPVTSIDFGTTSSTETFLIKNIGEVGSNVNWTISSPSVNWLTVAPMTGSTSTTSPSTVTLNVDRNAFVGQETTSITITGAGLTATVTMTIDNNVIVTDGMIAYYDFNDGQVTDWGGNYDGTNFNALTSTDTPDGQGLCFQFDGQTNYLYIPHVILLKGGSWSYNVWFKTAQNGCRLFTTDVSINCELLCCACISIDYSSRIYCSPAGGANSVWRTNNALTSYLNNQWHMLTITNNGSVISAYVDGVLFEQHGYANNYIWYGSYYNDATYFGNSYNGKFDNIRTYNRALTVEEVRALFNAKQ